MTEGLCCCRVLNGTGIGASPWCMRRSLLDVVAGMRVTLFLALMVVLLIPGFALAQEVFSSSAAPTTYSDQYSGRCEENEPPNVFKQVGMNPLVCHGQSGPEDSEKQCSYTGMTMIAHIGQTCYYCAPIVPPINGIIVPSDQVGNATNQGYKCGADQVDPDCMSICSKTGTLKYTPPGPNGGLPGPKSGPPAVYRTEVPGPAGGTGYTPGNNPCLPQGPGGYDYCQNGPGARLPAGCTCNVAKVDTPPPPGSKGITNKPIPAPDVPTIPNIPAFEKAMAKCLSGKLTYAFPQTVDPDFLRMAIDSYGPKANRNVPFAQLSPISQIFAEETAMALQTQETRDDVYGVDPYNYSDSIDYLVGWLDRCLASAGLRPLSNDNSPNIPWKLYAAYTGVAPKTLDDQYFIKGFTTFGITPPSLQPPQPPSKLPGLLPPASPVQSGSSGP
jgi:hypothetical protein